jgi:hypothetical protein
VTALHDAITRLSGTTETRLLALYERFAAGQLTATEFMSGAVAIVGKANATAYGLADTSLAAALEVASGRPTPALGIAPPEGDAERLAKGVATLVAAESSPVEELLGRIARFGRSEPVSAMQDAYVRAMGLREVPGYTRTLSPGACQLCQWLRKDGHVYPADQYFHRHEGCSCTPKPAVKTVRR